MKAISLMPYLTEEHKRFVDAPTNPIDTPGELTYALTRAVLTTNNLIDMEAAFDGAIERFLPKKPQYADYCAVIGALMCTSFEVFRRDPFHAADAIRLQTYARRFYAEVVAPYEDQKIKENGDVFPPSSYITG